MPVAPSGEIGVRLTKSEAGEFLLMVSDNGVGLPGEIQFRQSHFPRSPPRAYPDAGKCAPASKSRTAVGHPVSRLFQIPDPIHDRHRHPTASSRILVIEDEAIVAADIQDRLEALGYEVAGWGTTGAEALELARSSNPDLILMDIMLKGPMNGIQAAHLIRIELSLPVIFLTANSDEAVLDQAKISEPFAYLLKPFEERQLRTNIEMALYKSRMERERERLTKELQEALATIKTLSGLLPICAWCKSVRDDSGYWMRVEQYVEAAFPSHLLPQRLSGMCHPLLRLRGGRNPAHHSAGRNCPAARRSGYLGSLVGIIESV